jgi:hypothetical protein
VSEGLIGRQADGLAGRLLGLVAALLLEEAQGQHGVSPAVRGFGRQVLAEFLLGEFMPALLLEHEGALEVGGRVHRR